MRYLKDEAYLRILAQIDPESIWVEEGRGEVHPNEIDMAQALRDATLPELEKIIRQMNQAAASLDFASLGEDYEYLFNNALATLKEMYEKLYYEQQPQEMSEQEAL